MFILCKPLQVFLTVVILVLISIFKVTHRTESLDFVVFLRCCVLLIESILCVSIIWAYLTKRIWEFFFTSSQQEEEAHNSSPKQTNKRRKRGSCEGNMIKQSKTLHGESESDESKRKHYPFATTHASKPLYRFKNTKLTLFVVLFLPLSKLLVRTEWENGVRQSTRIKSRPPEYWRGERFLYGTYPWECKSHIRILPIH